MSQGPARIHQLQAETRKHYDSYTFDFNTEERAQTKMEKALLGKFLRQNAPKPGDVLTDIGCGAGIISSLVKRTYGVAPIGLDLSFVSAKKARQNGTPTVQGSNLDLPFRDGCADLIISNGVIQMTPDPRRSFNELCRILKPGGKLFLSMYNKLSLYYIIYNWFGWPWRKAREAGLEWLIRFVAFPLFYLPLALGNILILGSARRIPGKMAWHLFNDQIMAPQAAFYTFSEIESWAKNQGVVCLEKKKESFGFMLSFIFFKP